MKNLLKSAALLLVISSVSSAQWTQQQSNVSNDLLGVKFTSATNGWAVGNGGVVLKTSDGGTTWSQEQTPASGQLSKVDFVNSNDGWIVGGATILQTTDGGASWQINSNPSPYGEYNYSIYCVSSGNQPECWIAGGNRATNYTFVLNSPGSGNWSLQVAGFAGRLAGVYFINDSLGWAAGDNGLVLSTTNGGRWWNEQQTGISSYLADVGFFTPEIGICVGDSGRILRSTDGGVHWMMVHSNPPTDIFKVFISNDSVGYVAGGPYSSSGPADYIYRTTDAGKTWTNQFVNVPDGTMFEDICFVNDSVGWAVGHNGVIVHTTDAGVSAVPASPVLYSPATQDTLASSDSALVWYGVPHSTSYSVQIASDSSFGNIVIDSSGISDTMMVIRQIIDTKLSPETKYFWRVQAIDGTLSGLYSAIWSFITPTLTAVNTKQVGTPRAFTLSQNYPNPFNPSTTIKYSIPEAEFVNLTVYDGLGQKVTVLVDQQQGAGNYEVSFDADRFASGVYFYVIRAGDYAATRKMMTLK